MANEGSTSVPLISHQVSRVQSLNATPEEYDPEKKTGWKHFFLGNLDWSYVIKPISGYLQTTDDAGHLNFVGRNDYVPFLVTLLVGLQHAIAAYGSILMGPGFLTLAFPDTFGSNAYTVAFVVAGLSTILHSMDFKIPGTPYKIGSGMAGVLTNSSAFIFIYFPLLSDMTGVRDMTPEEAYGKVLGVSALCSLFFIGLSLVPRKYSKNVFTPTVSAIILVVVALQHAANGMKLWGGGVGCHDFGLPCDYNGDVSLLFGSREFMAFGLMTILLILIVETFGTSLSRHMWLLIASIPVFIIACFTKISGKSYVTSKRFDEADPIDFLWTTTYNFGFFDGAIMPLLAGYMITFIQANGVLAGTVEESGIESDSAEADENIQGGLIANGIMNLFACFAGGLPVTPCSNNCSHIQRTGVANRWASVIGGVCLVLAGIFGHFNAFAESIPLSIKGGLLLFLGLYAVITSLKILRKQKWDNRTMVIVAFSLAFGMINLLVPDMFTITLWPLAMDSNDFWESLRLAVVSSLRQPALLGGAIAILLNLILPANMETQQRKATTYSSEAQKSVATLSEVRASI